MTPEPEVLETTVTKRIRRLMKWQRAFWRRFASDHSRETGAYRNVMAAGARLRADDQRLLAKMASDKPDAPPLDVSPLVDICLRRSGRSKERGP